jgi:hypothetical protein
MEREPSARANSWATLSLGNINMETWTYRLGESKKIGTIKYGLESPRTQTLEGLRWRGQAATKNYKSISCQRGQHKITNLQMSKENFKEKEKLVTGPDCGLTPGQTG